MLSSLEINRRSRKEANVDGPKIIFDKSFLHRLKAEHLFELDIFFDIIPAPILKMEILADLSKPETPKTDWVSVAKSLCRKMARSGIELVHYRRAALAELADGQDIPMNGALLIDIDAPHVTAYSTGGIHIDGKQVQSEWKRWADVNFTDEERQVGEKLRSDINDLDMSAIQRLRKSMGPLYAHCKTSETLSLRMFVHSLTIPRLISKPSSSASRCRTLEYLMLTSL